MLIACAERDPTDRPLFAMRRGWAGTYDDDDDNDSDRVAASEKASGLCVDAHAYCARLEEALYEQWRADAPEYAVRSQRMAQALAGHGFDAMLEEFPNPRQAVRASDAHLARHTDFAIERQRATAAAEACRELMRKPIFADLVEQNADYMTKCVKCQKTDVTSYALQIRSADEGMTWFFECRNCPHRWNV
jgi:DNA-directed RNA polymerase subunit M/transcription elongation factor TFIIS